MAKKYKLTVLAIVTIAVISVLIVTNQTLFSTAEKDQIDIADRGGKVDAEEAADAEFKPTGDPYAAFLEARQNEKPIVLEFYARW